jgi:hypothetical protein
MRIFQLKMELQIGFFCMWVATLIFYKWIAIDKNREVLQYPVL